MAESSAQKADAEVDFDRLYSLYATDVLRMAYLYLGDRQQAEDVCQEVFIKLLTSTPELIPGSEKSWLIKVAVNKCRDIWRGSWAKRVVLGSPQFELIPAPDQFTQMEDEQAMMEAVNRLPAPFKEVVLLYYYQGYSVGEICEMLGLPSGTVSSRLNRGRKRLEHILKNETEEKGGSSDEEAE